MQDNLFYITYLYWEVLMSKEEVSAFKVFIQVNQGTET